MSNLRVNSIIPSVGTNVAIGTAGGTITYNANVSGVSTFSSGIVVSAGTTSAPSISPSEDSNTGIFFPSADTIVIGTGANERIRVGAAGSIGIGTDNPTKLIDINGNHSGITTTSKFLLHPHSAGWDLSATSGNIAPHYQTEISLYTGQIGSGTLRWRIDSSGRVKMPYQPAFLAYSADGQTTYGNAAEFILNLTQTNIGNHYSTTTGRFTAPVAGFYAFDCAIYAYTAGQMSFKLNGSDYNPGGDTLGLFSISSNTINGASVMLSLSANDSVSFGWRNSYSGDVYRAHGWFSGYLVG